MKRIITNAFVLMALMFTAGYSQWEFVKNFPDDNFLGISTRDASGNHGLAVDPAGKVWITFFEATDSIEYRPGRKGAIRLIYCFKPDGTPASFSPIKFLTFGGVVDTIGGRTLPNGNWDVNTNRGLNLDHEGNVLASSFDRVLRINYKTGAGINKVNVGEGGSITAAASDDSGRVYTHRVVGANRPIRIYDKDFTYIGNVVDSLPASSFSRTIAVSQNGLDVFFCAYTKNSIYKFSRPDDFSNFGKIPDTLARGFAVESIVFHPKTGHLWASSGSGLNPPNAFPGVATNWSAHTWYALDLAGGGAVKDSIKWANLIDPVNQRPRAIAFSPSGDTAYVGVFGGNNTPAPWSTVQMFKRKAVSVAERPSSIPEGYALSQNFPNPFNPTTEMQFSIAKAGVTTLKIYDMLGKEVATLVNKHLPAGTHRFTFDASRLATGAYIYEMRSNGVRLSKKMSFMK